MKKIIALLLACVMVIGMLAGCGSSQEAGTTAASADDGKKVFVYGVDAEIDDFSPITNQQTNYVSIFTFNVYEALFHLNEDMEYSMDLATAVEQKDDVTYEITLREGVKFHNGQDFTAADVISTINYIKDEKNGAWRAPQYATVADMTADGDYKLTIKLSTATPAFMDNLAYTPIMCKDDDPTTLSATANGTGAFKFVSYTPNDKIVLEKNEEYWDAANVSIEELDIKICPDYTVAITNLEAGDLDGLNRVTVENAATIDAKEGLKTIEGKSSNTVDLFEIGRHNCKPLSNPKVMEAMMLAFDAETINQTVYQGRGQVMTSCYPVAAKYHKDVYNNEYDLEKAKALLAETEYADGFEFKCELLSGYDAGEQAAIIWQAALSQIGITMNTVMEESSVWLDSYLGRTYDMIWNQYGMVGTDPATFDSIILSQLYPYQLADLPEVEELINKGMATSDEKVREEAYGQIQEIVAQYKPVFPYVSVPLICGLAQNVEGLQINSMGHLLFKSVTF